LVDDVTAIAVIGTPASAQVTMCLPGGRVSAQNTLPVMMPKNAITASSGRLIRFSLCTFMFNPQRFAISRLCAGFLNCHFSAKRQPGDQSGNDLGRYDNHSPNRNCFHGNWRGIIWKFHTTIVSRIRLRRDAVCTPSHTRRVAATSIFRDDLLDEQQARAYELPIDTNPALPQTSVPAECPMR
jgi:hypothetical protein